MITGNVTKAVSDNWKALYDRYASSMSANRKTGAEIDVVLETSINTVYKILKI